MNPFNFIFYFLIFFGFFLPTNSSYQLPFLPIDMSLIAFILLPVVNLFCTSKTPKPVLDNDSKLKIVYFFLIVIFSEFFLKSLIFKQSLFSPLISISYFIPLLSSFFLLITGIRCNLEIVWKVLLWTVFVSILISFITLFYFIPIYPKINSTVELLFESEGRLLNANAPFGVLGLFLLLRDQEKWYNKGFLVKIVSLFSLIALILTFNRTYLAIIIISILFFLVTKLDRKTVTKVILFLSAIVFIFSLAYAKFENVQKQVDRRIFSIILGDNTITKAGIKGNRDMIYKGMNDKIKEGYWLIGLPSNMPIFIKPQAFNVKDKIPMFITDTSIANVILRLGIFPLLIFLSIFIGFFRVNKTLFFRFCTVIFFLVSLNTDSLVRQNSIFFLIFVFILTYKIEGRNLINLEK